MSLRSKLLQIAARAMSILLLRLAARRAQGSHPITRTARVLGTPGSRPLFMIRETLWLILYAG